MATPIIQRSFAAGEISPRLQGHTDLDKYKAGVRLARNFRVDYRGGLSSRPGTAFIGFPTGQTAKPRLLKFAVTPDQTYVLVLDSANHIRFILDGSYVTDTPIAVTAGSNANPLTLTIPGNAYAIGDQVFLAGVVGLSRTNGVSGVNGRIVVVTNVAGNVVTFGTLPTGTAIDAHTWTAYTSGGTAARLYTIAHPWAAADLPNLNFAQSVDNTGIVLTIVNSGYAIYEIRRNGPLAWTCLPATIGTSQQPPYLLTGTPLNNDGTKTQFDVAYTVTAVNMITHEESIVTDPIIITNQALNQNTGVVNFMNWQWPAGASISFNVYATQQVPTGFLGGPPAVYVYGLIGTSQNGGFTDANYVRDASIVSPTNTNPFEFGSLSTATITQDGFGYIDPVFSVSDPTGSSGSVVATRSTIGAVTGAAVTAAGFDYSAPIATISEGDPTPGTGLVMAFSGAFTANGDGTFSPSPGSITFATPGTHYHVPIITLTATLAFNTLNPNDKSANVSLDVSHLIVSTTGSGGNGAGVRSVGAASTGRKYVEVTCNTNAIGDGFGVCTAAAAFGGVHGTTTGLWQKDSFGNFFGGGYDGVIMTNGNAGVNGIVSGGVSLAALSWVATNIIGIAIDFTSQLIWFKNISTASNWNNNALANPATGVGGISIALTSTQLYFVVGCNGGLIHASFLTCNFAGAFTGAVPAGFDAGWTGSASPVGQVGSYYATTINSVPASLNTVAPLIVPYTAGLSFTFTADDSLPGRVIAASQALGNVGLTGQNYPSVVAYFDQRIAYAATLTDPNTVWFSRVGIYHNFDESLPSQADDAIVATIVTSEINAITSLTPMASGLIALTSHGAYQISGGSPGAALTPTDITAAAQAFNGSSALRPLRVNYNLLFQSARGNEVRDVSYNFYVNVYTGQSVSYLSSHLFEGRKIVDWDYAEQPYYTAWCVRDDGIVLAFAYLREQELFGWTHCDTAGQYVAVVSVAETTEDAVYFAVLRHDAATGGNYYTIERQATTYLGGNFAANIPSSPELAWNVDCGASYPQPAPNGTLTGSCSAFGTLGAPDVILGGHGYSGAAFAQISDPTGTGGAVTLTIAGGVITAAAVSAAGSNYTNPQVVVIDATGTGADIVVPTQNVWTMTVSGSYTFAVGDVGSVLRVAGGVGTVLTRIGATQVTVGFPVAIRPYYLPQNAMPFGVMPNGQGSTVTILPQAPGTWTLTPPVSIVGGLDYLNGCYVVTNADGNVLPPQQVVDGCITLPAPASSIITGLPYVCQMQPLPLDVGDPTIQGRRKKVPALSLRALDTRGLKVGPNFGQLEEIKDRDNSQGFNVAIPFDAGGGVILPATVNGVQAFNPLYGSNIRRQVIATGWEIDGTFAVQQDYPMPVNIIAIIPEIDVGDDPG